MALPTSQDLDSLDYAFWGEPFNEGTGKSSIDLDTLDYAFWGEPFNANEYAATPPTGVMRFNLTPRIYRMLYYNQWS